MMSSTMWFNNNIPGSLLYTVGQKTCSCKEAGLVCSPRPVHPKFLKERHFSTRCPKEVHDPICVETQLLHKNVTKVLENVKLTS